MKLYERLDNYQDSKPAQPVLNLIELHSWDYRLLSTAATKRGVIGPYEWAVYNRTGGGLFVVCINDSIERVLEKAHKAGAL